MVLARFVIPGRRNAPDPEVGCRRFRVLGFAEPRNAGSAEC
jgi:hypothetical protein